MLRVNRSALAVIALACALTLQSQAVGAVIEPLGEKIGEARTGSTGAAISDDGRWVVFEAGATDSGAVSLWDAQTGVTTPIDEFSGFPVISADGRWVGYTKWERAVAGVYLWDRSTGTSLRLSEDAADRFVSISGDGAVAAWTEQGEAIVWQRATNERTSISFNTGRVLLSGNGRYLFGSTSMTRVVRYDLLADRELVLDVVPESVSHDGNTVGYSFPRFAPAERYGVGILQIDTNTSVELETDGNTARFSPIPGDLVLSGDGSTLFFSTAASLAVRDDDATPDDFGSPDTYRWVPDRDSLDFTDVPEDVVIDSSSDGRVVLTVGTEFAEIFGRFYGRYEFPPPLTTPDLVEVDDLSRPQLTDQVSRLYSAFFLRSPDAGGLRFWRDRRSAGWTVSQMADSFVASPEFVDRYGELSNVEFVELIYRNLFDRVSDSAGRAFWTSELSEGRTRGSVMVEFSESPEYIELTGTSTPSPGSSQQLWRLYRAYLGRDPDQGGFDFWYTQLANSVTVETVSEQFAQSQEFVDAYGSLDNAGFVDLIYRDVLSRASEPGGRSFWIAQLDSGRSRGSVMVAFSESPEYLRATDSLPG